MTKRQKLMIIGCCGKMGQTLSRFILTHADYELAAVVDTQHTNEDIGTILGLGNTNIRITDNIQLAISKNKIDIAIDFTTPATVINNASVCIQNKTPVIIGTTGIDFEGQKALSLLAKQMETGVLIVPNFAIGAILMMEFAQKAAKYMKNVEIIELHHSQKIDKPSGTAIKTRLGILESFEGADAANADVVPIHSVRLPGLVAHQEVIFGDVGQTLTIRHDSLNRESFMPGVELALKQIKHVKGLEIGLKL